MGKLSIMNFNINFRSEGSLNQHIKIKHPEFYQQMQTTNPNLPNETGTPGMNKRGGMDSSLNDGKSMRSDEESYSGDSD